VVIRDNFAFHHPSLDDVEAAFQLMANAMGELDVNEAHRELLGDVAPIANACLRSHSASLKRSSSNISAS
jgi:hypothetical protein